MKAAVITLAAIIILVIIAAIGSMKIGQKFSPVPSADSPPRDAWTKTLQFLQENLKST